MCYKTEWLYWRFLRSVFHIKISNEFNIFKKILNETKQNDMSSMNKTGCLPREDSLQELWRELKVCDRDRDEQGNEPPTRAKSCKLESK